MPGDCSRVIMFPISVSAKPCQTILLIVRSEPRFKSHTGGKIRQTFRLNQF